jgi:hypothetical protein
MDPRSGTPSRDLIVEDIVARTGIDEAMIDRLVLQPGFEWYSERPWRA